MRPQDNGRVRKEIIRFGLHFHLRENVGLWPPVPAPLPTTVPDRRL